MFGTPLTHMYASPIVSTLYTSCASTIASKVENMEGLTAQTKQIGVKRFLKAANLEKMSESPFGLQFIEHAYNLHGRARRTEVGERDYVHERNASRRI
jgi:hypothetical protein